MGCAGGMRALDEDTLIYEALAALPAIFGVRITESIVVMAFRTEGRAAWLGPAFRMDLEAIEAPDQLRVHLAQLQVNGMDGALVLILGQEPPHLREFMFKMRAGWPFTYHGGYAVQGQDAIELYSAHGHYRGRRDPLELLGTKAAQLLVDQPVRDSESQMRLVRDPKDEPAFLLAYRKRPNLRRLTGLVTHWAAGDSLDAATAGAFLAAMRNLVWRDGLMFWPECGPAHPSDFSKVFPDEPLGRRPDDARLARVAGVMHEVARLCPEGMAAPPLAICAYHAWYAGDGLRARVLAAQGLEEDENYSLLRLVDDGLILGARPPWVDGGDQRLVV